MDLIMNLVAVLGLTGVVATGILGGAIGVGMPLLLLVGVVDGPTGGRAAGWSATPHRVTERGHAREPHVEAHPAGSAT